MPRRRRDGDETENARRRRDGDEIENARRSCVSDIFINEDRAGREPEMNHFRGSIDTGFNNSNAFVEGQLSRVLALLESPEFGLEAIFDALESLGQRLGRQKGKDASGEIGRTLELVGELKDSLDQAIRPASGMLTTGPFIVQRTGHLTVTVQNMSEKKLDADINVRTLSGAQEQQLTMRRSVTLDPGMSVSHIFEKEIELAATAVLTVSPSEGTLAFAAILPLDQSGQCNIFRSIDFLRA